LTAEEELIALSEGSCHLGYLLALGIEDARLLGRH